jgi:cytochrome c-type biogenesis protein CcmE
MTQNYTLKGDLSEPFAAANATIEDELIPSHLAQQRRSGLNLKFMFAGGALIVLIICLIVYGSMTASSYYLTVSEIQEQVQRGDTVVGQRIRVNGAVVADSEDWDAQEVTLRFVIEDEDGETLPIVFFGPRPDNFQRAASAIVEGELLADGTFQADTLLLKCPSRYEEEPEEIFVQSTR